MKQLLLIGLILTALVTHGQPKLGKSKKIQVAPHGHHLMYDDGSPFFWLGDTAWELFHRLTKEEIQHYLDNRKAKGFNLIQAAILAEFDGLRKPNQYGHVPFQSLDPNKPNEKYFQLVDAVMEMAQQRGLVMGLLPTWGDKVSKMWGEGPEVFNDVNAFAYGKFLGTRYKKYPNIIWILGGDRVPKNETFDAIPVWRAMAKGIELTYGSNAIISYHIAGGDKTTSQYLHQEPWLDINMMQSGHGGGHDVPIWNWIQRDYQLKPTKPTLDSEPNYEDHPVNPWPKYDPANGYFNDYDVRKQTYRSVFAGACGVTYGHHSVWQFWSPREEKINFPLFYWMDAINRPGAFQVGYLRWLMESRPFLNSIPAQEVLLEMGDGGNHKQAIMGGDGSYLMVYLPIGSSVRIKTEKLSGNSYKVWWFNPRNGEARFAGIETKQARMNFIPPTWGPGEDWVLVLDDNQKEFPVPGTH